MPLPTTACLFACLQYLVQQAAQRVFLVADGGLKLLEGGVAEYVKQLGSSSGKQKMPASSAKSSGATAATAAKGGQKQPVVRKR